MNYGTHPLTVECYRDRTAADLRDIPITAHGYKCAVCKRAWNKGTSGRKKAASGGWRCPDCVAISKVETTTEHGAGASLKMTAARKKWTDFAAKASTQPALFEAPEQPRRRRAGACKKPSIPERDIQRQILDGLLLHPLVARIERINVMAGRLFGKDGKPSRFMRSCAKGRVDLDGFSTSGKVIAIEVKRPSTRNNVTDEQRAYLEQVKRAGGLAGVATCYEEAAAIVEGRNV